MKWWIALGLLAACTLDIPSTLAQTQKPLTNSDIVAMTKQGFEPSLIIKDIESSSTSFDVSPQALIDLKNAGVPQSVIEAMLSAHAKKPPALKRLTELCCHQRLRQLIHPSTSVTLLRAAFSGMVRKFP